MSLQWNQFWHVAPRNARESIEKSGINVRRGSPVWDEYGSKLGGKANFMWNNTRDARTYQQMANRASKDEESPNWSDNSGQDYDVWEVTIPKHAPHASRILEDPEFENAVATKLPIPRRFLRRIG